MGLSRNKVAVSEGAAGSPPFYGETAKRTRRFAVLTDSKEILLFNFQRPMREKVGFNNAGGPPVPIPNTEVKLCSGENTLRETVREDSSMPTLRKERKVKLPFLNRSKRRKAKPNYA